MEPRPLTTWEQKERDGLLALETDEWREKRLIAQDPNTKADVLERLTREINTAWSRIYQRASSSLPLPTKSRSDEYGFALLAEEVAANPNTPPQSLLSLTRSSVYTAALRGICRNPIAALICLEMPDFWLLFDERASKTLLRRETVPPQSAALLARHSDTDVAQAVKYHISVAGEIQSRDEGRRALTGFWQTYCSPEESEKRVLSEYAEEPLADLVKWGLAPTWALAGTTLSDTAAHATLPMAMAFFMRPLHRLLYQAFSMKYLNHHSRFIDFVAILQGDPIRKMMPHKNVTSDDWIERLEATLCLSVSAKPFSKKALSRVSWEYRPETYSPLDLLQHLAHDGNRFVRWAAQTRLTDPNFIFTWHEGE